MQNRVGASTSSKESDEESTGSCFQRGGRQEGSRLCLDSSGLNGMVSRGNGAVARVIIDGCYYMCGSLKDKSWLLSGNETVAMENVTIMWENGC